MAILEGTEKLSKQEAQAEITLQKANHGEIVATIQLRITAGSFKHARQNTKISTDDGARLREALEGKRKEFKLGALVLTVKDREVQITGNVKHQATGRTIDVETACGLDRLDSLVTKLPNHDPDKLREKEPEPEPEKKEKPTG